MPIMRDVSLFAAGLTTALALIVLSGLSAQSSAQTAAAAAAPQAKPPGLQCDSKIIVTDPFKGRLAGPDLPQGLLPIDDKTRASILGSGLPCQESVNPNGVNPDAIEAAGLENLQRGFDFYSWRTFVALNSPADGGRIEKSQA